MSISSYTRLTALALKARIMTLATLEQIAEEPAMNFANLLLTADQGIYKADNKKEMQLAIATLCDTLAEASGYVDYLNKLMKTATKCQPARHEALALYNELY